MKLGPHRLRGRRPHSDSFVRRLHQITQAAISSSLAEIDRVLEDWVDAHAVASAGQGWLLECVGPPEPHWLAAARDPMRGWPYQEAVGERIAHVADANDAIRFAREIDAINMARLLGIIGFYVPTEHEFVADDPPAALEKIGKPAG